MKVESESEVAQLCPTLHDHLDCSLPSSSVHGIFQAKILEWVAIAFSNGCESWTIKKVERRRTDASELWCLLEKTLESPLNCKEIQPVRPKGDQPWDFFGRNDAKAETPVLWPPHVKS